MQIAECLQATLVTEHARFVQMFIAYLASSLEVFKRVISYETLFG